VNQQINFYSSEFRPEVNAFQSLFMVQLVGILFVALLLSYVYARQGVYGVDQELKIVARQEQVALERLQNIRPLITSITGEQSWSEQLDEATRTLAQRQAVLSLMQGNRLGDTKGFSRHLRALARQDIDGIWLTHVELSARGDNTRLEGRALRAELIPLYVQELTAEPAFAQQRFLRFEIDNPVDNKQQALTFSMDSQVLLARNAEKKP
jgi:MSHA biogenesis protein MshI